jgi:glutamate-1-semialdehyde 2,1-aminomutase
MDAVHLARGLTGRDLLIKIEGSYHGHHDAVMVSVKPPPDLMGERDRPASVPYGLGYPSTTGGADAGRPVQRPAAMERVLDELSRSGGRG